MAVTTFSFITVGISSWTVPNYTGSITIEAISGGGGACVAVVGGYIVVPDANLVFGGGAGLMPNGSFLWKKVA